MMDGASPVCGFMKNPSMVDYPGHLAALFFTSGCNFRCGYCHNPELLQAWKKTIPYPKLAEACSAFSSQWVDAAVITGGEPTLAPGLEACIGFLQEYGWKIKLDTNGSRPDVLERLLAQVDFVAMDVKWSPEHYAERSGFSGVEAVFRSVELLKASGVDYEFRTTVVSSVHTDEEMDGIGRLVRGARRFVLKPFVPHENLPDPDLRHEPRTDPGRLRALKERLNDCADHVVVYGA
jgi:pyruvate formate lyase activating enzyme